MSRRIVAVAAVAGMLQASSARAQLPIPTTSQFDVTGFIEEATLDPACSANPHCGGTITVNGQVIVVPKELVVIFPASALTWQESFAQAPLPYGLTAAPPSTGMAAADLPVPLTTYEAHVVGNRVAGGGTDVYIAALVFISQHGLNSGAGFINFIDYGTGELRVGGAPGDSTTGARVRLNDPAGRYGRVASPDTRFTVDADNPTIMAGTGFPMCVPRSDPAVADDPLCPQAQRPIAAAGPPVRFQPSIQMNDPGNPGLVGVPPDPYKQVPFEIGDHVTFAGTLVADDAAAPTAGPWPGTGRTYVSAHTVVANVAVYTFPGTNPAYLMTEVALMGTGGLSVLGATEAVVRTRFEGMTTDPSRNIHLYGIDTDIAGNMADRDWGTIGVDPGSPNGAVKGRWRFRPPCLAAGGVATDTQCVMNAAGTFLPPTREMRAVIEGAWAPGQTAAAANGIIYGQYHAPIAQYIFSENIPGTPIVANDFDSIPFLMQGGYTTAGGTLVGRLNPWPNALVVDPAPTANAGGPYSVAEAGAVQLSGTFTGVLPLTFLWTVSSGSLSDPTIPDPFFNAVGAVSPVTATFTVNSAFGSATSITTILVYSVPPPSFCHIPPISIFSGQAITIPLCADDPSVPIVFTVTQSGVTALLNLTVTPTGPNTANLSFIAPTLPLGQVVSDVINLIVTATNSSGGSSTAFTTVDVMPLPDAIAVTAAQYRTGKLRLDVTATSSVVSPNVVLRLQPYLTTQGTIFDPSNLGSTFSNTGGGIYTLTLVGAQEPAVPPATPIVVRSNLNGVSPAASITVRR